ncbi:MAG: PIG-L deacetylase family protein [Thermoanaerobaculia bacterium]
MTTAVPAERVLVLAPHPDDEAIAAGGLIQRVTARGGDVRVAFITAGESNPWPQRLVNRRWTVTASDRAAWGRMRCGEASAALELLGAGSDSPMFLGFPDQKIASLARSGDQKVAESLRDVMRDYQPSLLVTPSAQDLHADHRAVAYFAHEAVRGLGGSAPEIVTYVVHGSGSASRLHFSLELSEREQQRKREAIECHRSQLFLSRGRFLAYARATEDFFEPEFDLVCTESRAKERVAMFRHSCRVLFGRAAREQRRKSEHVASADPEPHGR